MNIDHVVLWVENPQRSLDFFCEIMGMQAVRGEEYSRGDAPFPSVRINAHSIIDLMDRRMLGGAQRMTGAEAGGQPLNHLCLNLERARYEAISGRLEKEGVALNPGPETSFGAQGLTPHSFYFKDPDGNVIELRYYDEE